MTTNAIFIAILNASITCKKKNSEGKYDQYTTTALQDNFAHCPKPKDCTDAGAKSALTSLEKVFEYMESASVSRTDNQRNKAIEKAYDFARAYLKAIGINAGAGNVAMLTAAFAPKRQTTKGTVKSGYTTKSTFIKYALYLSYHFIQTGMWCDPKATTKKPSEHEELWAQMEKNKQAYEAEKANNEMMMTIIMSNPEALAAFKALQAHKA